MRYFKYYSESKYFIIRNINHVILEKKFVLDIG